MMPILSACYQIILSQLFSKEQHHMTLPNFIMIGVAKAGTTSFFRYLDQHPQIFMAPIKATNFFGYEDARAWKWTEEGDPPLLQNFPVRTFEEYEASFAGASSEIAIGE